MKAYLIQDAIGEISDKLIIDAERAWQRKMRRTPKAIFLLAACITICLSLMLAVFNRINAPLTDKPNTTPPGSDHSGVVPPEDNTIPDTPIDPDSLSEVLEIGYDAKTSVGGVDSCFKIAAKIDRSISLLQEKIPVTISYGISKGVKIDYFDIIGASEYKIAIYYADSNDYIILKEMNVKELFEKESFFDVDIFCDDNGDIINEIYTFCTEEIFYLDSEVIINSIINNEFQGLNENSFSIGIGFIDIPENQVNPGNSSHNIFVNEIKENNIKLYNAKEYFEIFGFIY